MGKEEQSEPRTESVVIEGLVRAAADGNRDAQEELLQRYWRMVQDVVRARRNRMGRGSTKRDDTQDLQQDVSILILRDLPKHVWQGRRAFLAWLKRLADNKVIDVARHHLAKKRDVWAETHADKADEVAVARRRSPETIVDQARGLSATEKYLQRLKPDYAAALRLHAVGYSNAEIGEVLDCTPEAARKLVARAIAKISILKRRQEAF